jgi:class 3 adenylate cyclase
MSPTPTDETVEATFAFVDLAGFTAVTEAHGDAEAVSIVRMFRDRALDVLRPGDELVKTIGDAVMLRFSTSKPPSPHYGSCCDASSSCRTRRSCRAPGPTTDAP